MTQLSTTSVSVVDGEIMIDATLLAPKLGLPPGALKAEMRKGLVTSVAETGADEDEGRTRLTFRYRSRTWVVVVEPDGSLVESPAPVQWREPPALLDHVKDALCQPFPTPLKTTRLPSPKSRPSIPGCGRLSNG